jgi:hypothetical protein
MISKKFMNNFYMQNDYKYAYNKCSYELMLGG